jgi:K+-transporting ATPase KdpF subunit
LTRRRRVLTLQAWIRGLCRATLHPLERAKESAVDWIYIVGAIVSLLLLGYLLVALLKPEAFS